MFHVLRATVAPKLDSADSFLALPFDSSVVLDQLLKHSEPPFPLLSCIIWRSPTVPIPGA